MANPISGILPPGYAQPAQAAASRPRPAGNSPANPPTQTTEKAGRDLVTLSKAFQTNTARPATPAVNQPATNVASAPTSAKKDDTVTISLYARTRQLRLEGMSVSQIAQELNLPVKTVSSYLAG